MHTLRKKHYLTNSIPHSNQNLWNQQYCDEVEVNSVPLVVNNSRFRIMNSVIVNIIQITEIRFQAERANFFVQSTCHLNILHLPQISIVLRLMVLKAIFDEKPKEGAGPSVKI